MNETCSDREAHQHKNSPERVKIPQKSNWVQMKLLKKNPRKKKKR